MTLYIDTGVDPYLEIGIERDGKFVKKRIKAERKQAEKLLPAILSLLAREKLTWKDVKGIKVNNEGGSFTSLRIGILTANALAYALEIPISSFSGKDVFRFKGGKAVKPRYNGEPNIGKSRKPTWG
ncbi:MAG: hypothetical protein ACM3PZ_02495 [Bacillota bacterium]